MLMNFESNKRLLSGGCLGIGAALLWLGLSSGAQAGVGKSGLEIIRAAQWDYAGHPDTEWVDWVVVSTAPGRIYFPSWTDEQRATFMADFDPDFLDMWSGQAMNRGDFFRMRGVAVNAPMEYEYQEAINPVVRYGFEFFTDNGIARKEDGSVALRPFNPKFASQCMCVMAPKWNEIVTQGILRPGVGADAILQDNLANPIYTWGQGFCDWCNRDFVAFMQARNSHSALQKLGFDPATFRIVDYLKKKRADFKETLVADEQQSLQEQEMDHGNNWELLQDPIIKEYIRFQHIRHLELVAEKSAALKRTAAELGRPIPAFYGNIPRISGLRAFPTIMVSQVDIAWSEESTEVQPTFFAGRQAWSTLLYKVGRAAGQFNKPVFTVQYHGGKHSDYGADKKLPTALSLAEAHANGGVPVQTWVATEWSHVHKSKPFDNQAALAPMLEVNRAHAAYAGKNRVLFTDRTSVAKVALVYSLPSTFWRQFQSLTVPRDHLDHFTAAARYLEEMHIPYDVLVLGHPDVFDDAPSLSRLSRYDTVILPNVDCISDVQADAIARWTKHGGDLVLWGEVGSRDEDMNPRQSPFFDDLTRDASHGIVRVVDEKTAKRFVFGTELLTSSRQQPQGWRYAFEGPQNDWYKPGFDDRAWAKGSAPFGDSKIRGVSPRTKWATPDIFMRRSFSLERVNPGPLLLDMIHWWDAEVYINGVLAARAPGHGRVFEGYQAVWVSPEAAAALKPGLNTVAVHCRRNPEDVKAGQIVDVGMSQLLPDEQMDGLIVPNSLIVRTDLPKSVWLNVWRYGDGPMTSVMFVNYDIDAMKDTVNPVEGRTLRLQLPDAKRLDEAYWIPADYQTGKVAEPQPIAFTRDGDWVEVALPRLDVFATVVFAAQDELAARTAAADARKWYERVRIAQRALAGEPVVSAEELNAAAGLLRQIQGTAPVVDFKDMEAQLLPLAAKLKAASEEITRRVQAHERTLRADTLGVDAVYKFDFGTAASEPGWIAIQPSTQYAENPGYGWTQNLDIVAVDRGLPDGVHGDFIRNINPADSTWPGKVQNRSYPFARPAHRPGEFRVNLPNGQYRVSVISGDYSEMKIPDGTSGEGNTASTYVEANGKLVLLGDTLRSGRFDSRTFRVNVTDGKLELRFFGANVGPLYASSIEWLVNGLVIQRLDQAPSPQAAQSEARRQHRADAAIRDWVIAGPYDDAACTGMTTPVGPETDLLTEPALADKYKAQHWTLFSADKDSAPLVPLSKLLGAKEGSAAVAVARIWSAGDQRAVLDVSLSQYGVVYLNGEVVHRDKYAVGALPDEARIPVKLCAGMNTLIIKTLHHWGDDWGFWAGLEGVGGKPLSGVENRTGRP